MQHGECLILFSEEIFALWKPVWTDPVHTGILKIL